MKRKLMKILPNKIIRYNLVIMSKFHICLMASFLVLWSLKKENHPKC